jgi:MFS family permease
MLSRTLSAYLVPYKGLSRSAWLISLASLINRSGTMVLPFLSVYLISDLHFTMEQAGIAMTLFGAGSFLGSFLGGNLTDRIGYHRVLFWSLFLGGIGFIALSYVKSLEGIYVMVFMLSTVGDAFRPATMAALAAHSTPENRTRSYSLMRMSINLGFTIGPAVGGVLAAWKGYYTLFWVDGITCIASAIFFRSILKPVQLSEAEKAAFKAADKPVVQSPYRDKQYLIFLLLTMLGATVFLQLISSLPVYYDKVMHMNEWQIGVLLAFNGLIVFLAEMPLVFTLERRMKRMNCIIAGIVLYAFGYLVLNIAPQSVAIAILSMFALSIGEIFNMPFANSFALSRATDANRGNYMGLYSMTYSVAHIIGPYFSMKIAERHGFDMLWYISGAICVLVAWGFMGMKKNNPDPTPTAQVAEEELMPVVPLEGTT